ncbi:MAG: glycosyltransferase [Opitutales bacterium]|nr:glycosyltransferase [Opitutales bacterium]
MGEEGSSLNPCLPAVSKFHSSLFRFHSFPNLTPSPLRFLIFNPFDDIPGEGPVLRYQTLARCLAERGHEVIWYSADFSHRRKLKRKLPQEDLPFTLKLLPVRSYQKNISLARLRSHADYARGIRQLAGTPPPDSTPTRIIASLPPLGSVSAALYLGRQWQAPVIVDLMDAWPETFSRLLPFRPGSLPNTLLSRLLFAPWYRTAKKAYRQADALSACAQTYLDLAHRRGARQPHHLCYHGTDLPHSPSTLRPSPSPLSSPPSPLRLTYIGAMEHTYDLPTVFRALELAREADLPVELHLAGEGTQAENWKTLAEKNNLLSEGTVTFHGHLKQEQLRELLAQSHVGIVPMDPASAVAVPYKAADYTAAGLPILSCLDNELGDLIQSFDAGYPYQHQDPESLFERLRTYHNHPETLTTHRHGARQLAQSLFDRPKTYEGFCEFLEKIVLMK